MATIKLKGGKVILKGGKASCTCCDYPSNNSIAAYSNVGPNGSSVYIG
jgi:hypothetical protein